MNRTSYDFLDVLKGTIDDKVSTLDQTIYCKVVGVNEDYTLDVTIVPDEHTRVRNVVNASKYEFKMGDYGILYKIGNNLANAFIIAKLGPSYADNQPLRKQVADENVGNNNSGGTVVNNYYQITQTAPTYTHLQSTPAATWTINHNMDKYPSVSVVTSAGDIVGGAEVNYINKNKLTISFSAAFSGKAYLN